MLYLYMLYREDGECVAREREIAIETRDSFVLEISGGCRTFQIVPNDLPRNVHQKGSPYLRAVRFSCPRTRLLLAIMVPFACRGKSSHRHCNSNSTVVDRVSALKSSKAGLNGKSTREMK